MKDFIKPVIAALLVVALYHFFLRGMLEKFVPKPFTPVAQA